jgi:hypothetical protein
MIEQLPFIARERLKPRNEQSRLDKLPRKGHVLSGL